MGTHIIWRNPSPPRKKSVQVSRITQNHAGAVYQAAGPSGFKLLLQVVHGNQTARVATAEGNAAMAAVLRGAGLVSARW